jgi:tRNA G10  N-methylase Trm11
MSRALVARIFDALFASGALSRGSVVVDPFGGIGTTAIEGASRGVQVVCCELEPKFFDLAKQNFDLHARDWQAMRRPTPRVVKGDSRKLREHVGPVLAECVVSSPPFTGVTQGTNGSWKELRAAWNANPENAGKPGFRPGQANVDAYDCPSTSDTYGSTPGQLGDLPTGEVDAVISSPPYAEIASGSGGLNTKPAKDGQQGGRSASSPSQDTDSRYGESDGQLARMALGDVDAIVSSPPFTQGYAGGGGINVKGYGADGKDKVGSRTYQGTGNERSDGNLETLTLGEVDAVVSSPPWGKDATGHVGEKKFQSPEDWLSAGRGNGASDAARLRQLERDREKTYGTSEGQLAEMPMEAPAVAQGETFWSAALDIVRESYAVLKPGGTAVWVVKMFVRDKQLVDFPGDWRKLCESVGFETVTEVHAMLVAEETRTDLFDGPVVKRRERKSFFRRLAEKKGSPRIDWETVYFMRKPLCG